ncbi:hypothetical protein IRJ41_008767 [Triplophysa rosa]|uniref:Uncharacterized protein n=1 Tax=Triplophysa rosa TaxID=992332 RepID=A0A9W7X5L3_TRIRA|nr:hypothetical protein IRJ41_008767 [Triplophysa rosa]
MQKSLSGGLPVMHHGFLALTGEDCYCCQATGDARSKVIQLYTAKLGQASQVPARLNEAASSETGVSHLPGR